MRRPRSRQLCVLCFLCVLFCIFLGVLAPASARAQIRAQPRAGAMPPWSKGILPISPESY